MQTPWDIGVDVAKQSVVVACAGGQCAPRTVDNQRGALRAWLATLPPGSRIGVEATGRYHERLADLAHMMGFTVYVLNPKDTRYYARSLGRRGKTDRVDAEVLARYVAKEHGELPAYGPASPAQRGIDRLLRRRARIVALRGALRATGADLPECRQELTASLQSFEALIARIDQQLDELMQATEGQRQHQQRLQTIVGVGPLVSTSLANTFSRIPFRSAEAFIAHTGLDPRPMDSGQKVGRRRLSKRGPAELRRLLYNAAMSGAKTATWRPVYEHYRAKGWSSTAALVILARKIARVAFAIYHNETTFNRERIAGALT
jgi:transposase